VKCLPEENVEEILTGYKVVAVVGASRDPSKDSNRVAKYLQSKGFHIVPVNPTAEEILNEKSFKSLLDIPAEIQKTIEIVDIFRPSVDVPNIVEQAVKMKKQNGTPRVIWMQLGIVNDEAAETAREAGMTVVMNKCMMKEHRRLFAHGVTKRTCISLKSGFS